MAVSVFKTFIAGEILTASDLNSSFSQLTANGEDVGWPATKAKDLNGQEFIMDADADSSITMDMDDRLDIRLGGVDLFQFDGTTASSVNGVDFVSVITGGDPLIQAFGTDTNITLELKGKGSGGVLIGAGALQLDDTSTDHQYLFAVSELSADRTTTLPLLTDNDTFVFEAHTQTLTNKTLTAPTITNSSFTTELTITDDIVHASDTDTRIGFTPDAFKINTGGSTRFNASNSGIQLGGANAIVTTILDEDNMSSDSATALITQQSAKAYVDSQVASGITLGTSVATTSGTAHNFTSLPSTVKRIAITFDEVSTDGTSNFLIQLGDSGGLETSGYVSHTSGHPGGGGGDDTDGFHVDNTIAATASSGTIYIELANSATDTWTAIGIFKDGTSTQTTVSGVKDLSATLDRVGVTTVGGDTFDGGNLNITYQG